MRKQAANIDVGNVITLKTNNNRMMECTWADSLNRLKYRLCVGIGYLDFIHTAIVCMSHRLQLNLPVDSGEVVTGAQHPQNNRQLRRFTFGLIYLLIIGIHARRSPPGSPPMHPPFTPVCGLTNWEGGVVGAGRPPVTGGNRYRIGSGERTCSHCRGSGGAISYYRLFSTCSSGSGLSGSVYGGPCRHWLSGWGLGGFGGGSGSRGGLLGGSGY